MDYAWGKGVVVVAAAGNSNTSAQFYPAAYNNVIAVGATDRNDAKASFSNYGSSWVDVTAPGVSILSTTVDGGYGLKSGTSMASPHVAGEAGLVWSKSGLCDPADSACVRNQIEGKSNPVSGSGTYWAKGRINANCAVSTAASEECDTTAPTVVGSSSTPANGTTGVALSTNITATFSEEMNPNTLTTSTVQLYQGRWASYRKKKKRRSRVVWFYQWVPVSDVQVSCDTPCKIVTLDPSSSLAANTNYKTVISTGAKDKVGNPLAQSYEWTFTTGST